MVQSCKLLCFSEAELDLKPCAVKLNNVPSRHVNVGREVNLVPAGIRIMSHDLMFRFIAFAYAFMTNAFPPSTSSGSQRERSRLSKSIFSPFILGRPLLPVRIPSCEYHREASSRKRLIRWNPIAQSSLTKVAFEIHASATT